MSVQKSLTQFINDPNKYVEKSCTNVTKMTHQRRIYIGIRSVVIGTGIGLGTCLLSSLTGSNSNVSNVTGLTTGILAGCANGLYESHEYNLVDHTADHMSQAFQQLKDAVVN